MLQVIPLWFCLSRVTHDLLNQENLGLLLNGMSDVATADTARAKVPGAFVASVLTNRVSQACVVSEEAGRGEEPAAVDED